MKKKPTKKATKSATFIPVLHGSMDVISDGKDGKDEKAFVDFNAARSSDGTRFLLSFDAKIGRLSPAMVSTGLVSVAKALQSRAVQK